MSRVAHRHARSTNMGTTVENVVAASAWAALNREFYLKASEDGRMSFNLGAPCKHGHRFLLSRAKGLLFFFLPVSNDFYAATRCARCPRLLRLPSGRIRFFERAPSARARIRRVSETFSHSRPRDDRKHSPRYSRYVFMKQEGRRGNEGQRARMLSDKEIRCFRARASKIGAIREGEN